MKKSKERIVQLTLLTLCIVILLVLLIANWAGIEKKLNINFVSYDNYKQLYKGLLNTFTITITGFLIGILMGLITCLIDGTTANNWFILVIKQIFKAYVAIFRGTPMVVQLLIIYFIVFAALTGNEMSVAIISFGLNSGAYVSEILRGGINSVPKGQMEAGRSLGLSYPQVMAKIIFPQAIRNALPSLGNEFITLIKETSIVGFIAAFDLTVAFRKIANSTYDYETVYIVMGITYFVIVFIFTKLFSLLERKLFNHVNTK